jgi:hypothetical protein
MSADSVSNKAAKKANKVVAQVPKSSTLGVSEYAWQPQNAPRSADARETWSMPRIQDEAGRGRFNYNTATPGEILDFNTKYQINQPVATQTARLPSAVASGSYGSGSGSGPTAADTLARDKWNAEQAAAGTATATALRALQGLQGRLASGGYRGNADTLLGLINDQNTQGQASIWDNYNTGIDNINAGYGTAQGLVNTGYGDLNQYLNTNQSNPYANIQQQVSPVNNAMANYLSAYGVSNDPVSQQVQASQMANQQGADSFNQLQQLMSANQLANNQSNLGLSQMAQNYGTTGLGSQRAAYQANADTARASAMNQLMDQINQSRFAVEQDAGTRKNALEEAIIGAGGAVDGTIAGPGVNAQPVAAGSATSRAQQVAAAPDNYPNFKAALADLNPNYKFTTLAAAKKKFPALAKEF